MKKCLLIFFCLIFAPFLRSNPPEYIIASIDGDAVTFENQASFKITIGQSLFFSSWQLGDRILIFPIEGELFSTLPKVKNNQFVLPGLILQNLDRNNTLRARLVTSPSFGQNGVFTITQIDLANRRITLNDFSEWIFSPGNLSTVSLWDIGQIVMIGQSTRPFPPFDMIFFNTDKPSTARVSQQ